MKIKIYSFLIIIIFTVACKKNSGGNFLPGQVKPGSAEYIMNQGIFFLNEGKTDMAEKKLLAALKKKSNLVGALNALGIVYTYKRKFEKAIACFKKVTLIDPKFFDSYNSLGLIYTELGKYDLAKENLLIAANSQDYSTPENAFANLATLEIKQNKLNSALRYLDKGIAKNRRFAPLYNLTGIIFEQQNKFSEAIENYKKALSLLTREDISYLVNIGRTYAKMGHKSEALDVLEKALAMATSPMLKNQIKDMISRLESR